MRRQFKQFKVFRTQKYSFETTWNYSEQKKVFHFYSVLFWLSKSIQPSFCAICTVSSVSSCQNVTETSSFKPKIARKLSPNEMITGFYYQFVRFINKKLVQWIICMLFPCFRTPERCFAMANDALWCIAIVPSNEHCHTVQSTNNDMCRDDKSRIILKFIPLESRLGYYIICRSDLLSEVNWSITVKRTWLPIEKFISMRFSRMNENVRHRYDGQQLINILLTFNEMRWVAETGSAK